MPLPREGVFAAATTGVALLTVCAGPIRQSDGVMPRESMLTFVEDAAHVEGDVVLEIVIDAGGRVRVERVLHSIPPLDQAARAAVERWRFAPIRLNGKAIPVVMTVTVHFALSGR